MQNGLSCAILVFVFCFLSIPAVAHGENVVIFLTTTGANSWTVPDDWNSASNTIEVIGSGWGDGGGPDGGGGGAYSKIFNLSLTASTEVSYKIGDGGAVGGVGVDTFLCNATSNCASIDDSAVQVGAKGGASGINGGSAASGIGTVKYSGGNGVAGVSCGAFCTTIGGGGGAAGPNGDGGDASGTTGGSGGAGSGGAGGSNGNAGGNGTEWDATHGSGGGGGATGAGGLYGGGRGGREGFGAETAGAQGIIVITYTPAEVPARVLRLQGVRFLGHVRLYGIGSGGEVSQDWYNQSWSNRVLLTIDNTEVDADLTDFPVYVDLSDLPAGFHTHVKSDGSDIRVTTSDGTTEVPREVVFYDSGTDTGELHFKGTLANATDTEFYIYYGNAGASDYATSDTYGAENVWSNGYVGVWHMGEEDAIDSTGYGNDGTATGSPALITGAVGPALDFNGSTDYILVANSSSLLEPDSTNEISVEAWINVTSHSSAYREIVRKGNASDAWFLLLNTTNKFALSTAGNNGEYSAGTAYPADSAWHHVVGTFGGGTIYMYQDGAETTSYGGAAISGNTSDLAIGALATGVQLFDGGIDEVRLSSVTRSAGWLSTEYSNQNAPNTFYTVGSEE